ncbi:hypothetical protein HNV11_09000 [Spirosoma taeanense]|uniref:Uncharacterized protein n=1 Tax=Spirosoma taeanense TaxID=2735870 RepID=A0A6M5Y6L3_9BACT|nr:hypothetical protein [Spirosoma taeanense]QJW89505.1 hypothetical protein HNV11_09000 [Spirosoma taeanense]
MKLDKIIDKVKHELNVLKGDETKDKTFSSEHTFSDEAAASEAFKQSVEKLFNVNAWSNLPGLNSQFQLFDSTGQPKSAEEPLIGDYIRIDLPGPTPENWVRVINRQTDGTMAEFTVMPSTDPMEKGELVQGETEHFFREEARSTFRVEQHGNRIVALEIGQNERINNQDSEAGNRAIANTVIAEVGWAFFQKLQWKKLTEYLVHL